MPGGNVNITCVAVGSPMPYVKWMMGTEDLTPEDDMPVGRNVLELTNVKESANYTCVAMSSLGVIESVAQITVKCEYSFLYSAMDGYWKCIPCYMIFTKIYPKYFLCCIRLSALVHAHFSYFSSRF